MSTINTIINFFGVLVVMLGFLPAAGVAIFYSCWYIALVVIAISVILEVVYKKGKCMYYIIATISGFISSCFFDGRPSGMNYSGLGKDLFFACLFALIAFPFYVRYIISVLDSISSSKPPKYYHTKDEVEKYKMDKNYTSE